ncbi:wax ester/triacylglycerol synthase family O-acyltransferase [Nonomuraea sp. NPDC050663]|uniref:wax ester/triacylglycerol synthase family O-acyltransferase n=1 Tax=Nonomuraea sp. NPDC050663 TaxID=3364370 RepID=UPI0037B1D1B0
MPQLTALDAQFLHFESATTAAHVAGVAILDPEGGTVTRDALADLLRDRMHLSPALTRRLKYPPFGLDHPYWVDDPGIDLDHHVFESRLPAPGDELRLAEHLSAIHERHLDRERPLWEMHLITGLSRGRVAVYTKVHHAAIDGVSGAETLAALLDLTPEPRTVEPVERAQADEPSLADMLTGALGRTATQGARTVRSLVRTAGELDAMPLVSSLPGSGLLSRTARWLGGDRRSHPELPALSAPRTMLNGPITGSRRLAFGSVPLKDVKRAAQAFGGSVNDVVMALCAGALRSWLEERGALPGRPLVAAVPVAVRTASAMEQAGNQLAMMAVPLATDVADPLERLAEVRKATGAAKRRLAMSSANWLAELCEVLPAPLAELATPAVSRAVSGAFPPINILISNVPGPQFPLYLCGGRVLSYFPVSVLTDLSGGVNITCFSYDGMLDFGLVACPSKVPDVWGLLGHLQSAMKELTRLEETTGDEFRHRVGIDLVSG